MTAWRAGFWPEPAVQHLAEDDLADLVAAELGALEQVGDDRGAELGRRRLGKRAAELADRGAGGGDDDDVGVMAISCRVNGAGDAKRERAAQAFCFDVATGRRLDRPCSLRLPGALGRGDLLAAERRAAKSTSRSTSCPGAPRPAPSQASGSAGRAARLADPVAALLLQRRVDHAGDVARGAEHEAALALQDLRCCDRRPATARCGPRARRRGRPAPSILPRSIFSPQTVSAARLA